MSLLDKTERYTRAREAQAAGFYPYFVPISESFDTEVVVHGERKIMVGSNNYLGLTHHPKVLAAAEAALRRYGTGCTGSRFLNGTLDLHEQLEDPSRALPGTRKPRSSSAPATRPTSACWRTLVGRDDHLFSDKLNHASLVDGARLGFGDGAPLPARTTCDALERQLAARPRRSRQADRHRRRLLDGRRHRRSARLIALAECYGAAVLVDDAHAIGVLGPTRRAAPRSTSACEDRVQLITATFSKSLASIGGVIGASGVGDPLPEAPRALAHLQREHAARIRRHRPRRARRDRRRARAPRSALAQHAAHAVRRSRSLGYDIGDSETPIIPVVIGGIDDMLVFWKALFDAGVYTNPVLPPAVPENSCRLRISMMATHTADHVERVLDAFAKVGRTMAVI